MKSRRNAHRGTEASGLLYEVDTFSITQNLLTLAPFLSNLKMLGVWNGRREGVVYISQGAKAQERVGGHSCNCRSLTVACESGFAGTVAGVKECMASEVGRDEVEVVDIRN